MNSRVRAPIFVCTMVFAGTCLSQSDPSRPDRPTSSSPECNPAVAAVIGGIFGALIGDKNRARGAAIGAGVGALVCAGINAMSKQTKDQAQVESEFLQKAGQLPVEPSVTVYRTSVTPAGLKLASGQKLTTVSEIEVVRGENVPVNEVKEQITLFGTDGKEVKQFAKIVNESGPGSGRFVNQFEFTFPQGVPEGKYPLELALFVNGRLVQKRDAVIQVATIESPTGLYLAELHLSVAQHR